MDLNQLKSFVAVAHQQNLTQAAETLHLSQPAVSAQIKALEKNLDIQLFERNAQGMNLTNAGKILLPKAETMLQQMHQLDVFAQSIKDEFHLQSKIGIIQMLPSWYLTECVTFLKQHYPHIHQNFSLGLSGIILNKVKQREFTGGFFVGDNPYRNVHSIDIMPLKFEVVMAKTWMGQFENHRLAMQHLPWVSLSAFSALTRFTQKIWRQWKVNPTTALQCDDMYALLHLVQAGHGVALLPSHYLDVHACDESLVRLPEVQLTEMLSFVYAIDFDQDPIIEAWKHTLTSVNQTLLQTQPIA